MNNLIFTLSPSHSFFLEILLLLSQPPFPMCTLSLQSMWFVWYRKPKPILDLRVPHKKLLFSDLPVASFVGSPSNGTSESATAAFGGNFSLNFTEYYQTQYRLHRT